MTKADLIRQLTTQISQLTKSQVEIVVNTIFESMKNALARGEKIEVRGFGSFKLRERQMKNGRNPKTGATVLIPPKKIPFFKVGKELRHMVNGSSLPQKPIFDHKEQSLHHNTPHSIHQEDFRRTNKPESS
ncbi:MAG: integration host factor subunit beta [Nitrospiraceae bacterium]|nr:integration host factor subunit beta [Nitrospiraceae bacterium]|tara:strand:- start:1791 stop:2183 length:393 start_codon:yes stop_codon:yes gene_type:complete